MKILGADGLTEGTNALNKIPSTYLSHGDCCCAKFNDKFYWYELDGSTSTPQNLPTVVTPEGTTENKRWLLRNIYLTELEVESLITSSIYAPSGGSIDFNNVATLSGDRFVFENLIGTAPFEVVSTTMVDNLNAELLGGYPASYFDISNQVDSGDRWIGPGVDSVDIYFSAPRFNTTYSLFTELINLIDDSTIIQHMVTEKRMDGFTIKLTSETNNEYYRLQWAVLGENVQYSSYKLVDVNTPANQFIDKLGFDIEVL